MVNHFAMSYRRAKSLIAHFIWKECWQAQKSWIHDLDTYILYAYEQNYRPMRATIEADLIWFSNSLKFPSMLVTDVKTLNDAHVIWQ